MRVCFITNSPHLGGAERVLLETLDVLKGREVECRVLLPRPGVLSSELTRIGVEHAFLDGGSWVSWSDPSAWDRIKATLKITGRLFTAIRKIRQWRCDAIYSNTITVCNGSIIARVLNLPHIWHLHEFGREDHGIFYKFGENFSNRTIGRLSSACIVVSQALAAKYGKYIDRSKLCVIYPSMHLAPYAASDSSADQSLVPPKASRFRLVIVGGLVEGKGQAEAVRGLAHLVKADVDAELLIVGESFPAYARKLERVVSENGLAERVHFIGKVDNPRPFFQSADLVLVCSRSEAFGRVTIEAMLAGTPIVGANCGATPELIQDGLRGFLYKSGDPADLAQKIIFLKQHPEVRQRLSENARHWAEGLFTRERYADQVAALISSVARTPSSPSGSVLLST